MSDLRKLLGEARSAVENSISWASFCGHNDTEVQFKSLLARIDAALAEKVEPVAWEYRRQTEEGWGMWRPCSKDEAEIMLRQKDSQVRPLYTAPADQRRRVEDGLLMIIAGALYDFGGFLTTRDSVMEIGSTKNASPMVDAIKEFAALRNLSLDDAAVLSWQQHLTALPEGE